MKSNFTLNDWLINQKIWLVCRYTSDNKIFFMTVNEEDGLPFLPITDLNSALKSNFMALEKEATEEAEKPIFYTLNRLSYICNQEKTIKVSYEYALAVPPNFIAVRCLNFEAEESVTSELGYTLSYTSVSDKSTYLIFYCACDNSLSHFLSFGNVEIFTNWIIPFTKDTRIISNTPIQQISENSIRSFIKRHEPERQKSVNKPAVVDVSQLEQEKQKFTSEQNDNLTNSLNTESIIRHLNEKMENVIYFRKKYYIINENLRITTNSYDVEDYLLSDFNSMEIRVANKYDFLGEIMKKKVLRSTIANFLSYDEILSQMGCINIDLNLRPSCFITSKRFYELYCSSVPEEYRENKISLLRRIKGIMKGLDSNATIKYKGQNVIPYIAERNEIWEEEYDD